MSGGRIHLIKEFPYFDNVQVNKEERDCMGIKVCQFTDLSLTSIEHNEIDIESSLWKNITENRNTDFKKTSTYITYLAAKGTSCKFKYNNEIACSRNLVLCKSHISQDLLNVYQWFIGCSMYHVGDKWHHYIKVDTCPFVAIVCVGTHNHPPPPPEKIPADIKLNLQTLITQAIEDNNIITPHYIQS
ncbi:21777_t:CDS:2, partial [Cetraspora pellucida]